MQPQSEILIFIFLASNTREFEDPSNLEGLIDDMVLKINKLHFN